jgi:hypothetical protein
MVNYLLQDMHNRATVRNAQGNMCYQMDTFDDLLGKLCWSVFDLQAPECSLFYSEARKIHKLTNNHISVTCFYT